MTVKIVSWNIWEGKYFADIINFLKTTSADIISLQEVVQEKGGRTNTAKIIANNLGYEFVYATASETEKEGRSLDRGNAILSKHKIVRDKIYTLSETDSRTAIEVDIVIENTTLHVFNTHLIHTHQKQSDTQNLQANSLVKVLPKTKTLLMGDFNATPESDTVKIVTKVLKNTDASNFPTWSVYSDGCQMCKPTSVYIKLDYIFASKDIKSKSFEVGSSKGSDHLPISVEIEI